MSYKTLKTYQTATIIYDFTVEFCDAFVKPTNRSDKSYRSYRTADQMVQAARSCKQNIVEGSSEMVSQKSEIKLLGVARASFKELLEDYEDFLRQRKLRLWAKDSAEAREVRALAYRTDKSYETYKTYVASPENAANAAICLINQAGFLLDRQICALEEKFVKEGGWTEKMFKRRVAYRATNRATNRANLIGPIGLIGPIIGLIGLIGLIGFIAPVAANAASGTTLDFDGTSDYLVASDNAVFDQADRLSISVWIQPDDTPGGDEYIVYRFNDYYLKMDTSRKIIGSVHTDVETVTSTSAITCDGSAWTHIEMTYDKDAGGTDEIKFYINGVLDAVGDYSTANAVSAELLYVGAADLDGLGVGVAVTNWFDGKIDDVRLYQYARSASNVRLDYNDGLATRLGGSPNRHSEPAGEESRGCSSDPAACVDYGLVGAWDMDEGSGDVAYDATTNDNHGNFPHTGPGLKFEGINDYVDCGNSITSYPFTIETWVKINDRTVSGGITHIVDENLGTVYYGLRFDGPSHKIKMDARNPSQVSTTLSVKVLENNIWYHLALVFNSATDRKLYIDGSFDKASTDNVTFDAGVDKTLIGKLRFEDSICVDGSIDEVRIYSRALGAGEVNEHYHGIFSDNTGRVGYWPFDEGEGDVVDNSGTCGAGCDGDLNGYTTAEQVVEYGDTNATGWVTFGASNTDFAPSWTEGKEGGALDFDGTDDYINCGNDPSLDITDAITIEAWVKIADSTSILHIVDKYKEIKGYNFYFLTGKSGKVRFLLREAAAHYIDTDTATWAVDQWYHLVATYDGSKQKIYVDGILDKEGGIDEFTWSIAATNFRIGTNHDNGYPFNGSIDGVKIYNRALSAEEVRYHYNRGGPVAHWKMDEGEGAKAYDESGNRNHGTLGGGTVAYEPTWVAGHSTAGPGSALSFDGTDDYVSAPYQSAVTENGTYTIILWVNPVEVASGQTLIQNAPGYGSNDRNFVGIGSGRAGGGYFDGSYKRRSGTIEANVWSQVVVVNNEGTISAYVNGVEGISTGSLSTARYANSAIMQIGRALDNTTPKQHFNGSIDDVKVFNYALTSAQILKEYNAGLAVHLK